MTVRPLSNPSPTVLPTVDLSTSSPTWRFYYYDGSARIAMRIKDDTHNLVFYLFADQLSSMNVTIIIPRFLGERPQRADGEPEPL